ncbi:hypothetical protein [Kitasatospora sp. NPDC048407]|uniref:hypothetical protein n=1 Tax=Kitasatospora sp. NPDC048407 TaxID=3364051 RepID=UPI00371CE5F5
MAKRYIAVLSVLDELIENDGDVSDARTRLSELQGPLHLRGPAFGCDQIAGDGLYLVLSEPPAEDWSADTIRDIFDVHVIWRSPDGWGGRDTEIALGSAGT